MPPRPSLFLYLHTIRYLKIAQIIGRFVHWLPRPVPASGAQPSVRSSPGRWTRCSGRPSALGPAKFCFLSVEHEIVGTADWNRPGWPKLWLYHLHYFDDLNASNAQARSEWHRALISRWVDENAPGTGVGWEAYPTSIRITNWVKWALAGNTLEPAWEQSLALQTRWLYSRLEWHLMGNHLLANAKALMFSGAYFRGSQADAWLGRALAIFQEQLAEQVLPDGGHFERSPMYHAIICEDLLDLLHLADLFPGLFANSVVQSWRETARRMIAWISVMTHPDGEIAQFNDSVLDDASPAEDLRHYAEGLGVRVTPEARSLIHLADTGYVRMEQGSAVAFLDVAPIGPDYLPGHAHADTLTFELSLFGERWIVDTGCSTYELGAQRLFERGTSAHNTVLVDDVNSSEVWGSFRVARRARIVNLSVVDDDRELIVTASHDGYQRLPGCVTHARTWRLRRGFLELVDQLSGRYEKATSHLLVHPSVLVAQLGTRRLRLERDGRRASISVDGARLRVEPAAWHPQFGMSLPTQRIVADCDSPRVVTTLEW